MSKDAQLTQKKSGKEKEKKTGGVIRRKITKW